MNKTEMDPKLSILICTLNDRIKTVGDMLLEPRDEIRYVISFQYTDDIFADMFPQSLKERSDVTVLPLPGVGLSANRNNSLKHCKTPLAILSDDDVKYTHELLDGVIQQFEASPDLDILRYQRGRLALRIHPLLPEFDSRFGLGSAYLACGEEEVFLHKCKHLGFTIADIDAPLCIGSQPLPWRRFPHDKRVRRSWGALQGVTHGSYFTALLKVIQHAIRVPAARSAHRIRQRWQFFRDMYDGLRYITDHPQEPDADYALYLS